MAVQVRLAEEKPRVEEKPHCGIYRLRKSHENQRAGHRSQLSDNWLRSLRVTSSPQPSNSSAIEGHMWNGVTVEFCSVYLVVCVSGFDPQHWKGRKATDHLACNTGILWPRSHRNKRNQWVKKLFMWLQLASNLPFCGCFHSYRNWKSIFGGLDINISLHNIFSCYCQIFTGRNRTSWWGKSWRPKKATNGS